MVVHELKIHQHIILMLYLIYERLNAKKFINLLVFQNLKFPSYNHLLNNYSNLIKYFYFLLIILLPHHHNLQHYQKNLNIYQYKLFLQHKLFQLIILKLIKQLKMVLFHMIYLQLLYHLVMLFLLVFFLITLIFLLIIPNIFKRLLLSFLFYLNPLIQIYLDKPIYFKPFLKTMLLFS